MLSEKNQEAPASTLANSMLASRNTLRFYSKYILSFNKIVWKDVKINHFESKSDSCWILIFFFAKYIVLFKLLSENNTNEIT